MSLIEKLAPKDTEEVRPGIFVQKREKKYRVVNPIAWEGQWRFKDQFSWKNLITIAIIIFLAWTYFNETSFSRQLQENPCEILPNITQYCFERNNHLILNDQVINGEREYNFTIQDYP